MWRALQGCFFLALASAALAHDVTLYRIRGQECEQATLAREDVEKAQHFVLEGMKIGSCTESGFGWPATTQSVAIPLIDTPVTVTHMKKSMWEVASLKAQSWLGPFLQFNGGKQKQPISRPAPKPNYFRRDDDDWMDGVTTPLESTGFLKQRADESSVISRSDDSSPFAPTLKPWWNTIQQNDEAAGILNIKTTDSGTEMQHAQHKSSMGITRSAVMRGTAGIVSTIAASRSGIMSAPLKMAAFSKLAHESILYDTSQSQTLPSLAKALSDVAGTLANSRVIFTGEKHTSPVHHAFQLEVIKKVDNLDDNPTIIGLEMLYRQHQPALDAFVFGEPSVGGGSLAKLAERTRWESTWGHPIDLYADVFNFARQKKIRLCGLNLPQPIVRMVSEDGLEKLDPQLRNTLPKIDLNDAEHRRRFMEALPNLEASKADHYYEAMALWDDYMASSIAHYITPSPKDGAGFDGATLKTMPTTGKERMVVLVGSNHVRGRVGIPNRFFRRTGLPSFNIVAWDTDPWEGDKPPEIGSPDLKAEADWVLFTKPPQEEVFNV